MYNVVKDKKTTTYSFDKPTVKAGVRKEVELKEVLPVLGEGVIRFLASLGYEKGEIVKVFGEGLMTAGLEFKN